MFPVKFSFCRLRGEGAGIVYRFDTEPSILWPLLNSDVEDDLRVIRDDMGLVNDLDRPIRKLG